MLTDEQRQRIEALQIEWFRIAVSTERADRPRAEKAIKPLAVSGGVTITKIVWVESPQAGAKAYARLLNASQKNPNSLRDSLSASLRASLRASLDDLRWDSWWNSLDDLLQDSLDASIWNSLDASLSASLSVSLRDSLQNSLWYSLWRSLEGSLRDSLDYLRRGSLWDLLRDSIWDSLRTSPGVALYLGGKIVGATYSDTDTRYLAALAEVLASCFAIWIGPGWAILCDRPTSIEIVDGRLVGMEWGIDAQHSITKGEGEC